VAELARLFAYKKNILVFIYDIQIRFRDTQVRVLFAGPFKKLIVNVKLQRIPRSELIGPVSATAVHFDAFETNIFLQERRREQWNSFRDEAVKPLAGVVLPDDDFLHG
jgi:hypothetical protein